MSAVLWSVPYRRPKSEVPAVSSRQKEVQKRENAKQRRGGGNKRETERERERERERDRQTDRQTETERKGERQRQTDRQTDRDRQTERQTAYKEVGEEQKWE